MDTLSTGLFTLALVLSIIAGLAAWAAMRAAATTDQARAETLKEVRRVRDLGDRVTAIEGRLDRLAGRVYQQARRPRAVDDELPDAPLSDDARDDEFAALLRLQSAPPVAPGKRSG